MRRIAILLLSLVLTAATVAVPAKVARLDDGASVVATAATMTIRAAQAERPVTSGKRCHAGAGLLGCPFLAAAQPLRGAPTVSASVSPEVAGSWPEGAGAGTDTPPPKTVSA